MKKIISVFCTAVLMQTGFGQNNSALTNFSDESYFANGDQLNFIRLKESYRIDAANVTAFLNEKLFENGINKAVLLKTESDERGFTHLKYTIYQNGIMLANKVIMAHCKEGKLISLNGDLVNADASQNTFLISEKSALTAALNKIKAIKYKWENKEEERHMAEVLNEPGFSYYPKAVKVIFEKDGKNYSAYEFNIYAEAPLYRCNVFVDASTGKILDEQNLICTADVPGTAVTKYSGTQAFTCDQNGSSYRLRETQRGLGIETYNMNNGSTYTNVDFVNSSTNWTVVSVDQGATDAHWGAEKTYDYYMSQYGRNSINNAGYKLVSYIHYQTNYQNAFWDGQRMTYGDGTGGKIFTTMDICGHEITHGLTSNTGNLNYSNEPGALNESFSDIFGTCIENYARPSNWNWRIAEDLYANPASASSGFRSMSNPNLFSNPDTYGGTYYYTGTQDNGGVHTNSSVGNFWFYLLTTGGSGTNDLGNAYNVTGIGMTSAAKIAYRALTVYFTPSTNFMSARNLCIQAAKDLFGNCSVEAEQTTRAWYAVGVGANYSATNFGTNFISSGTNFCSVPSTVNFTNQTSSGLSYIWYFGDGATATGTNATHTYTTAGVYNIKLKSYGCGSVADSLIKTSYITVNGPVSNPVVSGGTGCMNASGTISATGSGTIKWYDNQFGGNLLGVGSTFITPNLNVNTTYYAENSLTLAPQYGGMTSFTGGGTTNSNTQWLFFDVTQSSILESVIVNAQSAGARVVELRNSGNIVLNTTTVNLTVGTNTIVLDYMLSPGTNYKLALNASSTSGLYRSTSGVTYPYNIAGCVNITGSSAGTSSYYFFYKWKIQQLECASQRLSGTVVVNPLPIVSITAPSAIVCINDMGPIIGHPSGGSFTANNLNLGSTFNPSLIGLGTYSVMYSYTDGNGCTDSTSSEFKIDECAGVSALSNSSNAISVYPNPATEKVYIKYDSEKKSTEVVLMDASGKLILSKKISEKEQVIDLSSYAKGMYLLIIKDEKETIKSIKLVKE